MDKIQLIDILENSPSIKLLKMRTKNLKFFLLFLLDVFDDKTAVSWEYIHQRLVIRFDGMDDDDIEEEDDDKMPNTIETNEEKARRWITNWTNNGYLTNYQNEVGEVMYEISAYTSKVIDWIDNSLRKEEYVGTESKFNSLFGQLKELVEFTNENRSKRLELLKEKKAEIERQIEQLENGDDVTVFEDYQIVPRYNSLNKLAKELLSDFKEVDNNFKDIIKQIYQQQTENSQKKEILNYTFDAYSKLKNSSQGKSFYAFWDFLLSSNLQNEWKTMTQELFESLDNRHIDVHDFFLKDIILYLFNAGQNVCRTNDRMAEKLSRIIRQNEQSDYSVTKQTINDIKKMLIGISKRRETPDIGFEIEEIKIRLPLERPLTLEPAQEIEYNDRPANADLSIDDLNRIGQLYNAYFVDRETLRNNIDAVLKKKKQATLGEVIEASKGITKGLTEIFGYINVLKGYSTTVNADRTQDIIFDTENRRKIVIPEIIIVRK